jgi:hypothetical protein
MLLSAKYLLFIKWEDKEPYKITHILNNIAWQIDNFMLDYKWGVTRTKTLLILEPSIN